MATAINLGFPRIGAQRELKKAVEAYWSGKSSRPDLMDAAKRIRQANWQLQSEAGISHVPTGDFSFYDHVLDAAFALDLIPQRFRDLKIEDDLDLYFAMARGLSAGKQTPALEMTKWFDTNYHYLVPEFTGGEEFRLARTDWVDQYTEAVALGHGARPVVLGPVSLLLSGKAKTPGLAPLCLLDRALNAYEELLKRFAAAGASWVQIDEPMLVLDLNDEIRQAIAASFQRFATSTPELKILLATYFGSLRNNLDFALRLPVNAIHLDLIRGPEQLDPAIQNAPEHLGLSLGLVDGRNVWKTALTPALERAEQAAEALGSNRIMIGPSCSLLHVPVDLSLETSIAPEIREWLAFGRQKLEEVAVLTRALNEGRDAVRAHLEKNAEALQSRRTSNLVFHAGVQARLAAISRKDLARKSEHASRREQQQTVLHLPTFPTTTIGSFPQTSELRRERLRLRKGQITPAEYEVFIRREIEHAIQRQEGLGLDVLVHGEAERNDMVEYFGSLLAGFVFTGNGWVQSYGSRCVKPPIIYGDVARTAPMTVDWWRLAQSFTTRPVKGMLTGPVTILQWSFVRDDQPRRDTCRQLALAVREETLDLETAGCRVIQIDEPALREGLPLRAADAPEYLAWAVDCFRLASAGVKDSTQIHTHMCYADFNDIVDAIAAMDADVISLESARSQMELLQVFEKNRYSNDIGPGVYDIHSPRVPDQREIVGLLERALKVIPAERLWVNPDCGLKTRRWEEVLPALEHMVGAARAIRSLYARQNSGHGVH